MNKTISQKLASASLNLIQSFIEGYGGRVPNDDRARDLWESLERYIRESLGTS